MNDVGESEGKRGTHEFAHIQIPSQTSEGEREGGNAKTNKVTHENVLAQNFNHFSFWGKGDFFVFRTEKKHQKPQVSGHWPD